MNALIDGILSALAEAVVLGRLAMLGVDHVSLPNIPTWAFCLAAVAHVAGNAAARASEAGTPGDASRGTGSSASVSSGSGRTDRRRPVLLALWLAPMLILGYISARAYDLLGYGGIFTTMLTWIVASARGIASATQPAGSESARRGLVSGTVILGLLSLVRLRNGSPGVAEILAFLLLTTALLVYRRRQEVARRIFSQEGTPWAAGGAAFTVVVLVSVLVVYAIGSGGFGAVVQVLKTIRDLVAVAIGYIMLPFAYLVEWLINRMQRAMEGRELEIRLETRGLGDELAKQLRENQQLAEAPEWLKWGGLVLIIAAIIGVAWLLVSRLHRRSQREAALETRESLVEGGAVREWWDSVTQGARDIAAGALEGLRSLIGREPQTLEEVYAATLALLGKKVLPRETHVTPHEYRCLVSDYISDEAVKRALDTITDVFCAYYYSEREPGTSEMKPVIDAYRLLQTASFSPDLKQVSQPSVENPHG